MMTDYTAEQVKVLIDRCYDVLACSFPKVKDKEVKKIKAQAKWSLTKPSNACETFSLKAEFSYKRHFNDRKSKRSCNKERKSKQLTS
jgi:hypothetical protein